MKVFILTAIGFNKHWNLPFYNYALSIKNLFNKKKIECNLVSSEANVGENDLFIVFQPYFSLLKKKYNNLILIISESIHTPKKYLNIFNLLKINKNNIKLILDYSQENINFIKSKFNIPIIFCPPMYSPVIENKVNNNQEKEYDILFYGSLNDRRKKILNQLEKNYKTILYCNKDNNKLFDLMGKSKIIVIINFYERNLPYDFYRISFLLTNKVFFIQEDVKKENKCINLDIPMSSYDKFNENCKKYLTLTQDERDKICNKNYEHFKKHFNLENYFNINKFVS